MATQKTTTTTINYGSLWRLQETKTGNSLLETEANITMDTYKDNADGFASSTVLALSCIFL